MSRIAALVATFMLVVACGGAGSTPTPAGGGAALVTAAQTSLGQVLVGSNGHTLYAFTPDESAGKPTCNDACAATWPPVTVTGTDFSVGSGLDKSKFKLVARDDGSMQLAIGAYPLYLYGPDINAGDVNGQGKGGKWFVVGTDGEPIGETSSSINY